jgi:glucose/arabinose dehydrogenase
MPRILLGLLTALVLACGSNGTPSGNGPPPSGTVAIALETVASGLDAPVHLTSPPGDERLFVVEQEGRIRIIEEDTLVQVPFLDIAARVDAGGERGLLGLAFHPDYAINGRLFVNFTSGGATRIEELNVTPDPYRASPDPVRTLLVIDQPAGNHNGGLLAFGPDGYLWIGMGDGGGAGDRYANGQDPTTLLGAMLRVDVDSGDPYAIPEGNPFADGVGGAPEVWAYGLRNPWRWAFDTGTGLLWIADVGQGRWEEINARPVDEAGINYGWNIMEGAHCYEASDCATTGLTLPVHEYPHSDGCSITGGFVYRGEAIPPLVGRYLYADYCEGWIRSLRLEGGVAVDIVDHGVGSIGTILSFGMDDANELYVLTGAGTVYRIVGADG